MPAPTICQCSDRDGSTLLRILPFANSWLFQAQERSPQADHRRENLLDMAAPHLGAGPSLACSRSMITNERAARPVMLFDKWALPAMLSGAGLKRWGSLFRACVKLDLSCRDFFAAIVAYRKGFASDQAESLVARKFFQCDEISLGLHTLS